MDKIDHLFFQAYLRVEPNFACMPVEVRFIILNGISILLGLAFGLSSNVALRKFLSLFFGIGLQVLMFKTSILYGIGFALLNYAFLYTSPKTGLTLAFTINLLLLGAVHGYSYYISDTELLNIKLVLMNFTLKCISVASNIYNASRRSEILSKEKLDRVLHGRPRVYDYLSYLYFYPTCFWGPFLEYDDYQQFIHKKGSYSDFPSFISRVLTGIFYVLLCIPIFGLVYLTGLTMIPHTVVRFNVMSSYSLITRLGYYNAASLLNRARDYYLLFFMTQASMSMTGITLRVYYNGGEKKFELRNSIGCGDPIAECTTKPSYFIQRFAVGLNDFGKKYLYDVLRDAKFTRQEAIMAVSLFVLLWLGPHPMIAVCIVLGYFYWDACERLSRSKFSVWNSIPTPLRVIISYIINWSVLNALLLSYQMLSTKVMFEFLASVHLFPLMLLTAIVTAGFLFGKRETLLKKGEKDREAVEIDDETQDYLSYEKALYEAKRQIAIQEYLAEKKKKEQ